MEHTHSYSMETKVGTIGGLASGVIYGFFNFIISGTFWSTFFIALFTAFCTGIAGYYGTLFAKWLRKTITRK